MNNAKQTHNAQKTLADLRDHLARHDKPIAFFFGAGTSCAVQVRSPNNTGKMQSLIPAVSGLTQLSKDDASKLGDKYAKAWTLLETHCKDNNQDANVENILSRLRMMLSAIGKTDSLLGLNRGEIERLEQSVRKTIARVVNPDLNSIGVDFPHRTFARWLVKTSRQKPIEIFTVNYDVLIEHGLETQRVPMYDGFVGSYRPFFHPDSLRRLEAAPGVTWVRLWKMHGSITWRRIEQDGRYRVVRGEPDPAGEMIYPSFQKYDESRQQPYAAFTDRLCRFLEQDDALLIVAGFSFGDEHINNLIFGALENRPRTHVYALQFDELPDDSDLARRALQRTNLIVVGPKTGIIGGQRAPWAPEDTSSLLDSAFELKQEPSTGYEGAAAEAGLKSGLMKLGDFASLCAFLGAMTTE